MKTQLSKSADQKIRTKGILCAQMREIKRKNTLDRKSNVEKTLILSRVFLFWIRGIRNQCFPTAPSLLIFDFFHLFNPHSHACIAWHMQTASWRNINASYLWTIRQTGTFKLLTEKSPVIFFQPFH